MESITYEQALVVAARNGNPKCFEELYRMYCQRVYALARRTLNSDESAETVARITFIAAGSCRRRKPSSTSSTPRPPMPPPMPRGRWAVRW